MLCGRLGFCFGSYYQMVRMFAAVEATPGSKDKMTLIRDYQSSLPKEQLTEFQSLIKWYSNKQPIRISSKIVSKYYLQNMVPPSQKEIVEPQLSEGGIMKILCKNNQESQLSIYDINFFLRYLSALEGKGSTTEKSQKIIAFGQNVSEIEGMFLLKLLERKLTIGASSKTFNKLAQELMQQQQ